MGEEARASALEKQSFSSLPPRGGYTDLDGLVFPTSLPGPYRDRQGGGAVRANFRSTKVRAAMLRSVQDVAALDRSPEYSVLSGRSLMMRAAERRLTLLMQQNFDFVWRSLRRLGLDIADADDATQEVFVVASRKLDAILPGRERSFLFGTALKIAATRRRKLRRRPERVDADIEEQDERSAPGPERLTQLTQAREILQGLLNQMPLELRAPFVLFELEELTVPQIAELLAIPLGTVSSRLRSARAEFQAGVRRIRARDGFQGRAR